MLKSRWWRTLPAVGLLALTSAVAVPAAAAPSAPHAAQKYQFGINTYVTYNCVTTSTYLKWAHNTINGYKALGANTIALAFPLYTDSMTSNNIYAKLVCNDGAYQSPTAALLGDIVQIAHAAKLKVLIRPLLDQTNLQEMNHSNWRGAIEPTNLNTWFTNYLTTLRPYLQMAQADHVEHFVLETELDSIANAPNWSAAIALSRAIYKGDLAFNYSWDTTVTKTPRSGTSFAIDAYPGLTGTTKSTTPAQLTAKWTALLKQADFKIPNIKATTIDEIGIPAQTGAYAYPYSDSLPLAKFPFNQTIQANWFTAACSFVKQHHMGGIYYWGPWLGTNSGTLLKSPNPNATVNIQPAAQKAIRKCFG